MAGKIGIALEVREAIAAHRDGQPIAFPSRRGWISGHGAAPKDSASLTAALKRGR